MTKIVLLGDLVDDIAMGPFGSNLKVDNFTSSGVPVVKGGNLYEREVGGDFSFVTEEKAQSLKRSLAYPDDIVITHRGTLGQISIVPHNKYPYYLVSQSQLRLTPNKEKIDPFYLLYYLRSPIGQHELMQHTSQVGVPSIATPTKAIKSFKIFTPDLKIQQKIANIVRTFDEKIELNRRMNETLERMGQALFRYYFIDDAESKTWPVFKLGGYLSSLESGSRPKGGAIKDGIPSIGAENIEGLGVYDYSKEKYVSKEYFEKLQRGKVQSEDVLLYKDGAYVGKKSLFMKGYPHEICCVNEHVFILRANNLLPSQFYLYFWLSQDDITKRIKDSGIKAAQPGINQTNVNDLPMLVPPSDNVVEFDHFLRPFMERLFLNAVQSRDLTKLRDSLLPRLISGKIKV